MTASAPALFSRPFRRNATAFLRIVGLALAPALVAAQGPATEVLAKLRARDAMFSNYRVSGTAEVVIFEAALDPEIMKHFGGSQSDRAQLERPHWKRTTSHFATQTNGEAWAYESSGDNGLKYSNDPDSPLVSPGLVVFKKRDNTPVSANLSVVAGKHPALGLGLGDVVDVKLQQTGTGLILSGMLPGRGTVEAEMGDRRSAELTKLKLTVGKSTVLTEYGRYRSLGGARVPGSAKTTVSTPGQQPWFASYRIEALSLGSAARPNVPKWFQPGFAFIDERLGPPVHFEYSELLRLNLGSTDLTAARLLEFSRAKLARQGPAGKVQAHGGYFDLLIAMIAVTVLVALVGFAVYLRGRRH